MRTDDIIFLIIMGCIILLLIAAAVHNKKKFGTITNPYHHIDDYDPARDPAKTDYYKRVEETVRQRELARHQKKTEKARAKNVHDKH